MILAHPQVLKVTKSRLILLEVTTDIATGLQKVHSKLSTLLLLEEDTKFSLDLARVATEPSTRSMIFLSIRDSNNLSLEKAWFT